jgi:subtilisin family serine protease
MRMSKKKSKRGKLPSQVYAELSPKSLGYKSLFDLDEPVTAQNVKEYFSDRDEIVKTIKQLRELKIKVLGTNGITINVVAVPKQYEEVFNTKLIAYELPSMKPFGQMSTTTFIDTDDNDEPAFIDSTRSRTPLADLLEGGAINRKVYFMSSYLPPNTTYWNLDVPSEVSLALNADRVHRANVTGRSIKVVMTDTGWYRHPFFVQRGYRINPTVLSPGATNPDHDESGHGTGESANIFAVAPDAEFTMVKMNDVNPTADINAAVALRPDIISCSWGFDLREEDGGPTTGLPAYLQPLSAAVANAVSQGIIVVFSTGNGHYGFPGMHPDVISAGGVYMHPDGSLEATQYASGFDSSIYPDRKVPDVCGLVGLPPKAIYITLPIEPNCDIDQRLAAGQHPNGDETTKKDGWAAFSGTSAAAPQLAGICALIKQACPKLSPTQVRDILKKTARDVTRGKCSASTGAHPARPGPDLATGTGLVDALRAVHEAQEFCS